MSLTDRSLRDLLTAFSSPAPTPGGGSAAALGSAIGASLLLMVAGMPKTRTGSDDERAALSGAAGTLAELRVQLTGAIDADSAAYDEVVAAYKLPKASADEQSARKLAIQSSLRSATAVPLDVLRLSAAALEAAIPIARHGHRAAMSDVGVAVALLRAGGRGAQLNVMVNTGSVADPAYVSAVAAEAARLWGAASRAADEADALL